MILSTVQCTVVSRPNSMEINGVVFAAQPVSLGSTMRSWVARPFSIKSVQPCDIMIWQSKYEATSAFLTFLTKQYQQMNLSQPTNYHGIWHWSMFLYSTAGTDINFNSVAMVGDNSEYRLIKPGETEERIVAAQSLAGGGWGSPDKDKLRKRQVVVWLVSRSSCCNCCLLNLTPNWLTPLQ